MTEVSEKAAPVEAPKTEAAKPVLLPLNFKPTDETRKKYTAVGQDHNGKHHEYEIELLDRPYNMYALKVDGKYLMHDDKHAATHAGTYAEEGQKQIFVPKEYKVGKEGEEGYVNHGNIMTFYYIKDTKAVAQLFEPGEYGKLSPEARSQRREKAS